MNSWLPSNTATSPVSSRTCWSSPGIDNQSIWCATSPQLDGLGGVYWQNSDIAQVVPTATQARLAIGKLDTQGVMPYAIDPESAERLWKLSESLI
ncbi:hypothetical protein [Actinocrispum sp. NPDC049592]|uniref:hypothetical protein n=1 Tax=Actinocrispum sp. NPDC049592 TaxID=3154835 RepID=UPI00342B9AEE